MWLSQSLLGGCSAEEFCAEAWLTSDQLLALGGGRPEFVEVIGERLRGTGRADRQTKETTKQRLWKAWEMGNHS